MTISQCDPVAIHKQDGVMSHEDRCPFCNSRIMENAIGNKWCTNIACNYHIRSRKQAIVPRVTVLADGRC